MQNSKTKSEAGLLVLVVFALGLLVGGVGNHLWGAHVWGWGSQVPPQRGVGHVQPPPISQVLGLSPDQQKQWDAIFKDAQPQFEALDAQQKALHEQTRAKFRAILSPEQQAKFDAMRNSRGRGGPNRGGPPGGDHGPGAGQHPGPGF